jgi:hypothetical protein
LRRVVHEYEETNEQEKPPARQQETRTNTPDLSASSMGLGTQEAVQGLLKEIQSLKRQQTELQDNVYSLQTSLTAYINAQKRSSDDLNQVISAQKVISESIDRLLTKTPSKEDLRGSGAAGVSGTQLSDLTYDCCLNKH